MKEVYLLLSVCASDTVKIGDNHTSQRINKPSLKELTLIAQSKSGESVYTPYKVALLSPLSTLPAVFSVKHTHLARMLI